MLCVLLLAYFVHHAMTGRFGMESLARLDQETQRLEFELAAVTAQRQSLEARVLLLHDGTMERDMLDEQARYHLNMLASDEIAIMRTPLEQ